MTGAVRWPDDGLLPGVVQDAASGEVLMVGYLNETAWAATTATGLVHFWSRSRNRLWQKGETSGNTLRLVDAAIDCDGDALLLRVEPQGPVCHTGAATCFQPADGAAPSPVRLEGFARLEALWSTVVDRARRRPDGSYTAQLLAGGTNACARKLLEETGEVMLAARDHADGVCEDRRLAEEAADLTYHLLVLLAERGVAPGAVLDVLAERAG
jgi:phosphoribosyl-ATP pyrophosphohydrolase/phosphoribosyl-AMP cyclohydrolase